MKIFKKIVFLLFISQVLFTSCSLKQGKSKPIYDDWKIKFGDNQNYSAPDYDDSTW